MPYSKPCDTFRPRIGQGAAIRAGLGGELLVDFFKPGAMLNSLVRELHSEGRPACIKNRLRHAGFGESRGICIAYCDVIEFPNDTIRELVVKIFSPVGNLCMDNPDTPLLVRALCDGKRLLSVTIDALRFDLLPSGERGEVFQAEVDTNAALRLTSVGGRRLNIDNDVKKPVAARVSRKVGAILDFSIRQRATIKHTEGVPGETERIAFAPNIRSFNWNPSKRLSTTVTQEWAPLLIPTLGVLLAYSINCICEQTKLLAGSGRQSNQVKSREPRAPESQGVFLPIVTKVPDKITCPRLLIQQSSQ